MTDNTTIRYCTVPGCGWNLPHTHHANGMVSGMVQTSTAGIPIDLHATCQARLADLVNEKDAMILRRERRIAKLETVVASARACAYKEMLVSNCKAHDEWRAFIDALVALDATTTPEVTTP